MVIPLSEYKEYFNIAPSVTVNDSTLTTIGESAEMIVSNYLNTSISDTDVIESSVVEFEGYYLLAKSNVKAITSVKLNGEAVTEYTLTNNCKINLQCYPGDLIEVVYNCLGVINIFPVKLAILKIAFLEYRDSPIGSATLGIATENKNSAGTTTGKTYDTRAVQKILNGLSLYRNINV